MRVTNYLRVECAQLARARKLSALDSQVISDSHLAGGMHIILTLYIV